MCDNKNNNFLKDEDDMKRVLYDISTILDKNNKLKKKDDLYLYDLM